MNIFFIGSPEWFHRMTLSTKFCVRGAVQAFIRDNPREISKNCCEKAYDYHKDQNAQPFGESLEEISHVLDDMGGEKLF